MRSVFVKRILFHSQTTKPLNAFLHRSSRFASIQSTKLVDKEYDSPTVTTKSFPGANDTKLRTELDSFYKGSEIQFFVDYDKSIGNYIADVDNNIYLDLFQSISSIPLGYNNQDMIDQLIHNPQNIAWMVNRPALASCPPKEFGDTVHNAFMSVAPDGLDELQLMMCGTCANENALKVALIHHANRKRGGRGPTDKDLTSCMEHKEPGTPSNLGIIAFEGAFHGRTLLSLSCTQSNPIHKVDIPVSDMILRTPFPANKFPLNETNTQHNANMESECLSNIKTMIQTSDKEIAALIIEPIQAEGGDRHASNAFFKKLRKLCADHEIVFIVDEVQTGCGPTGAFWAHEHWKLDEKDGGPPDIVTFAKKMCSSGFYYQKYLKVHEAYRIFNTWCGDPIKVLQTQVVIDSIKKHNLLQNVNETGQYLMDALSALEADESGICNVRGKGTFIAFDCADTEQRNQLIQSLRLNGIHIGGCGAKSIRLRPALIFKMKHAQIFIEQLRTSLMSIK